MNKTFSDLGISEALVGGLLKAEISLPTDVQAEVVPAALEGRDIVGQSPTGTGKTLAYLLPLFQKIDPASRETQALVLAPTHELAVQINRQAEILAANSGVPVLSALIIGQANITRQIEALRGKPHIIVGSSGRILELIQKKKISAHTVKTIVIDEADRLLDDSNFADVAAVIKTTLKERQMMLFSATIAPQTLAKAKPWLRNPLLVNVSAKTPVPKDITHAFFICELREKFEAMRKLAGHMEVDQALVFVNQTESIEITVEKLKFHGCDAGGLYGSLKQVERKNTMDAFRSGKLQFLVASDLAARGLDIPGVDCVFNLEMPEDPDKYLHRAGRTGRAGESGSVISLVAKHEMPVLRKLERALNIKMEGIQHERVIQRKLSK